MRTEWKASVLRAFSLCAIACACAIVRAQAPASIVITDVSVVDVENGRAVGPRTVVVTGGEIAAIGALSDVHIPPGSEHVAGRGRFLIPGLVDMHVHLFNNASHRPPNAWSFPLYVANGVTGVREMAAVPDSMVAVKNWRAEQASGALIAPRILSAGVVANGASPAEAAQRVDAAADAGADFIKVFSDVSEPNWRAILEAAKRRSLPVEGHVPAGVPVLTAASAGQRTDEHLMQVFEACSTIETSALDARRGLDRDDLTARGDEQEPRVLAAYDQRTCDRTAAALAKSAQVQVPTLVLAWVESKPGDRAIGDPRLKYLRADELERWVRIDRQLTPEQRAIAAQRWNVARKIAATLQRAGVMILAGTDSPMPGVYPGYALHDELERLVDAGLSPAQALRSATLGPARFLGIAERSGTIEVGKRADLVLLDADPLRDIANTRRIESVVLGGRLLTRAALDALLADAEHAASTH